MKKFLYIIFLKSYFSFYTLQYNTNNERYIFIQGHYILYIYKITLIFKV